MDDQVGFFHRAIGMLGALGIYGTHLFLPSHLSVAYDLPFDGRFGLPQVRGLVVLGLGLLALWQWRKNRSTIAVGILWFLVALIPFNNLFPRFAGVMADRYLYLSLMGFALALAGVAARFRTFGRSLPVFAGGLLIVLIAVMGARGQTKVWQNSETLWQNAIDTNSQAVLPYLQLGQALEAKARGRSLAETKVLLDAASRLFASAEERCQDDRQKAQALIKVASLETRRGRFDAALAAFGRLDAVLPGLGQLAARDRAELDHAKVTRATVLTGLGRFDAAWQLLEEIQFGSPADREARQSKAGLLILEADRILRKSQSPANQKRGIKKYSEGLQAYIDLLELWPQYERARIDYSKALIAARWLKGFEIEIHQSR